MKADLVHPAALAAERAPDRLGLHLLFAFGVLLLFIAAVGGMRHAWRRRAKQQEEVLPELPHPPGHPGAVLAAPLRGMYLGTVDAGHWLEWIAGRGLGGRAVGYVTVYETGVQVDRAGTAFWIPREAVRGARLERAHAGKVAGPGRLVVIAWSYGDHEFETGFRGEDRSRQPKVVRAVHDLIGPMPTRPADGEVTSPHQVPRGRLRLRSRTDPAPPGAPPTGPTRRAAPDLAAPQPAAPQPGAAGTGAADPAASPPATQPLARTGPGPKSGHTGPATMPIPAVVRASPGAARPPAARPPAEGGPGRAPSAPAGPDTGEHALIDPLTSPLGEVVRRMREDR